MPRPRSRSRIEGLTKSGVDKNCAKKIKLRATLVKQKMN